MANIVLKNIYKVYEGGVRAVSDFNLEIGDKEFIVFVGPSGCGKSTTLRMIAGLEEITAGTLLMDGERVNDVEPKDRNIAMVFQNYALYPHMTVFQNMSFGLKIHKVPSEEIESRVKTAAEILGITDLLTRKPKALSGGQRQRVALGRAIVREPKVFLLDEPLSNLDAKLRVQMRTEITKLHQKLETTFIYVTHDQTEAMTMGSRIVVMKDGLIQQADTPAILYNEPINVFVATFLGSPQMNIIDTTMRRDEKNIYVMVGGKEVKIPELKSKQYVGSKDLKDVLFGIRPENIVISHESGIPAKIDIVEHLGKETIVYCKIKDREENIIANVPSDPTLKAGMDIYLELALDKCHLFDVETKRSVMGVPEYNEFSGSYKDGVVKIGDLEWRMGKDFTDRVFDFTSKRCNKIQINTSKISTDEKPDSVTVSGKVDFVVKSSEDTAVYVSVKGVNGHFVYRTKKQDIKEGDSIKLYIPEESIYLRDDDDRLISQHVVSKNTSTCVVTRVNDKMQVKVGPVSLTIDAIDGISDGEHKIRLRSDKLKLVFDRKYVKENKLEKQLSEPNTVKALAYDEDILGKSNATFVKIPGWDDYVTAVLPNNFSVYKMPKFALVIPSESVIIE